MLIRPVARSGTGTEPWHARFLLGWQSFPEMQMPTPVAEAMSQIMTTYALIAPEIEDDRLRAELAPYLEGLAKGGEENVHTLAVAGLTFLRRKSRSLA